MIEQPSFNRIAVTGGAGYLGTLTCRHLQNRGKIVRSIDIVKNSSAPGLWDEAIVDLADMEKVEAALKDVDLVIHLGANLAVDDWSPILQSNIVGTYNIFESARRLGIRRVIYASSHHVSGMYRTTTRLDTNAPTRPDSLYGLSKAFAEQTAQYYWDKYGIESAGLRIGSARPKPEQPREHYTWLSEPDYCRLVDACMSTVLLEHTLVWGISDNEGGWWDNSLVSHLGYAPRDGAERFEGTMSPADAASLEFQGGKRALYGLTKKS